MGRGVVMELLSAFWRNVNETSDASPYLLQFPKLHTFINTDTLQSLPFFTFSSLSLFPRLSIFAPRLVLLPSNGDHLRWHGVLEYHYGVAHHLDSWFGDGGSIPEVLVAADAADATVVVNTLIILWRLNARPGRWREATL
jgi:hypothetical protein